MNVAEVNKIQMNGTDSKRQQNSRVVSKERLNKTGAESIPESIKPIDNNSNQLVSFN